MEIATTSTSDSVDSGTPPAQLLCFQTGPSLECIPDDVLDEIISHLPTLTNAHALFGLYLLDPPVVPSTSLVRTPTLRALSQTSRLLRSRCLAMAWQKVELCGVSLPKHKNTFYEAIGEATKAAVGVLEASPYLWPLIQTVSVVFTPHQRDEIIPAFAACLAKLPYLANIQVIHARFELRIPIKNAFEGKLLPSVRKISLACSSHGILKCCPNLEEVTCTYGDGSFLITSLVEGNCHRVRVLRGFNAVLMPLVEPLSNTLRHISVSTGRYIQQLTNFPLLDTIEIDLHWSSMLGEDVPLREVAASELKEAGKILKENSSKARKMVVVSAWSACLSQMGDGDHCLKASANRECVAIEAIEV